MCTLAMELQASEAISPPTEPSPLPTRNSSFSQQQNVWIQLAYELLTVILIPVGKVFLSPLGLMHYSILGFSQFGVSLMASKALNRAAGWESRVALLVCKVSDTHAVGHGTLPHTKPEAVGKPPQSGPLLDFREQQ